ncbi:hypothetical protein FRC09_008776 [Ceratobasidium sp. 395]|nr:hypothetical protein FRC09_008776 [Ceratobasidium sp. 395]
MLHVQGQNQMLSEWSSEAIEAFLNNLYAQEPPHSASLLCDSCKANAQELYTCQDCLSDTILCQLCLTRRYAALPSHQFCLWNGTYFEKIDSTEAGYVYHLGHHGRPCTMGKEQSFTLRDINGIHVLHVRFCNHPAHASHVRQLMQAQIFPCSKYQPLSGFTYGLLRQFSLLASKSKLSAQRYWDVLVSLTDTTHPERVPDQYRELLRTVREWDHLQDIKQSESSNLRKTETPEPDLALQCPACPHPNVNYDPEDINADNRHLFTQHISFDGSFYLYCKKKAFNAWDTCLSDGRKYFAPLQPFERFLQDQLSRKTGPRAKDANCNNHKAADNKWVRFEGAEETGIGSAICARHSMFMAHGTVSFKSREMFLYADLVFKHLLERCLLEGITSAGIHYNIICHYIIKMWDRWKHIHCANRDVTEDNFECFLAAIPKFHLAGHTLICFIRCALNHLFGVGLLDAEGGERCWANLNHVATSTSDRGPGSHFDMINTIMQQWNRKKTISMASYLARKWNEAIEMQQEQYNAWLEFSATFPAEDVCAWEGLSTEPERVDGKWTSVFALPENDAQQTNYLVAMSLTIKLQELVECEQLPATSISSSQPVGLSAWISHGINVQVQQLVLRADVKVLTSKSKPAQHAAIDQRRTQLLEQIQWFIKQSDKYYSSETHTYHVASTSSDGHPEDLVLGLPSNFLVDASSLEVDKAAVRVERDIRHILCLKTLQDVRSLSVQRLHVQKAHNKHGHGVISVARAASMQERVQKQIVHSQTRYNLHQTALLTLGASDADKAAFRHLTTGDLKDMLKDMGKLQPLGDGRVTLPWY